MNQKLMYAIPMMVLALSMVSAAYFYSLRGTGGSVVQVEGNPFSASSIDFSAYVTPDATGGQGSLSLQGTNRYSVQWSSSQVLVDNANILQVQAQGFRYVTTRINGFPVTQKVSGTVTFTYDKIAGLTDVVGSNGLNFQVDNIPTTRLR